MYKVNREKTERKTSYEGICTMDRQERYKLETIYQVSILIHATPYGVVACLTIG